MKYAGCGNVFMWNMLPSQINVFLVVPLRIPLLCHWSKSLLAVFVVGKQLMLPLRRCPKLDLKVLRPAGILTKTFMKIIICSEWEFCLWDKNNFGWSKKQTKPTECVGALLTIDLKRGFGYLQSCLCPNSLGWNVDVLDADGGPSEFYERVVWSGRKRWLELQICVCLRNPHKLLCDIEVSRVGWSVGGIGGQLGIQQRCGHPHLQSLGLQITAAAPKVDFPEKRMWGIKHWWDEISRSYPHSFLSATAAEMSRQL